MSRSHPTYHTKVSAEKKSIEPKWVKGAHLYISEEIIEIFKYLELLDALCFKKKNVMGQKHKTIYVFH